MDRSAPDLEAEVRQGADAAEMLRHADDAQSRLRLARAGRDAHGEISSGAPPSPSTPTSRLVRPSRRAGSPDPRSTVVPPCLSLWSYMIVEID